MIPRPADDAPAEPPDVAQEDNPETGESFAQRGAGKPGARTKEIQAVNAYQDKLKAAYEKWSGDLADELESADEDEREDLIASALLALAATLKTLGRENLPNRYGSRLLSGVRKSAEGPIHSVRHHSVSRTPAY